MAFEILVDDTTNHQVIRLRDTTTKMEAEVFTFGAILNAVRLPFEQTVINIIAGFDSPEDAADHLRPFFRGAKLSPFVCRINRGRYSYHGKEFTIEKNYLQQHAIHGLIFDGLYTITETITDQESASVQLQYHYDGSDNGYPWEFDTRVQYTLSSGGMLSVKTTMSHTNPFAIPFADGWHPYFNLDTNVDECYLQFNSATSLEFDDTMIPTTRINMDDRFTTKRYMDGVTLDNCFVLDHAAGQPRVILSSEKLQLTILPEPSYPFLQIYTPDDRKSIAIECLSGAPDCFNNGMGLQLVDPNETRSFVTHYVVEIIS